MSAYEKLILTFHSNALDYSPESTAFLKAFYSMTLL